MWFLGLFTSLLYVGVLSTLFGWAILKIIYRYKKHLSTSEYFAASPLIGTGAFMLLFGYTSYLGLPGKYAGPLLIVIMVLSIVWVRKKMGVSIISRSYYRFSLYHYLLIISSLLGGTIVLIPVLFYHAYNPYNDTFTYLSISDYLYQYPFSRPADPNPYFPILSQPKLYQAHSFRMGANFFLSFIQSIIPVNRSYQIYPLAISWAVILNTLAIYLGCRWLFHISRFYAWLGALSAAILINPLHYAAANGFFPQLLGLAFFTFSIALLARTVYVRSSLIHQKISVILLALATAFLISSYSELAPVQLIIVGTIFIIQILRSIHNPSQLSIYFKFGIIFVILTALFANIEIYRMLLALPTQLHATVGWHIAFSWIEYLGTALGIEPQTGWNMTAHQLSKYIYIPLIFGLVCLVFVAMLRQKIKISSVVWLVSILIFSGLFGYFATLTFDPWTQTRGHTWSMFKIVHWVYPIMAIGLAVAMSQFDYKKCWLFAMLFSLIVNLYAHHKIAKTSIIDIQKMTFSSHPFTAYEKLTHLVNQLLPANIPIRFELNETDIKHRQMLAYFLYPHPVIANWNTDGYIFPWMKEENRNLQTNTSLVLSSREIGNTYTDAFAAGVVGVMKKTSEQ